MTDPMERIADALELLALTMDDDTIDDGDSAMRHDLRKRIEARHSERTLCSFGCGRVATETMGGEPACSDGDACLAAKPLKPAPQTVDVLGSELRMGDVVIGVRDDTGRAIAWVPKEVTGVWYARPEAVHCVRLPRPAAEPSAKVKCATCRCMLAPGTTCACCESTSGDDPPLPSLDRDEEPSGEGIARFERARLVIGSDEWALSDLQAHQPTSWVPRVVDAINAAHANATRELRERCERAERELVSATNALTHERVLARAQNERCEHAERVVEAARRYGLAGNVTVRLLEQYDRARQDGAK